MPKEMHLSDRTTLAEAREWLNQAVGDVDGDGAVCPCCARFDKIYDRPVARSAIRDLVALYKRGPGFHHYTTFIPNRVYPAEMSRLVSIDLIVRASNDDETKKTSGSYQITAKGMAFVRGTIAIPERLVFYHDKLIGVSPKVKFIREMWPQFDYSEVMGRAEAG